MLAARFVDGGIMKSSCVGFCALCYSNVRGRSNYGGHRGYRPSNRRRGLPSMSLIKRASAPPAGEASLGDFADVEFQAVYPALFEFISLTRWDDGTVRAPGSITVFSEDGRLKACINDKDGLRVAFVAADSVRCLALAIDGGLLDGSLDWRRARPPAAAGRGRARS